MKSYPYAHAIQKVGQGLVKFDSDVFGVLLLKASYSLTADLLDTHTFVSDLTPATHEASGSGYARQSFTGAWTFVEDTGGAPGNLYKFTTASPTTFPALGVPGTPLLFRYAVVYRYGATGSTFDATPPGDTDSTAILLTVLDFESTLSAVGEDLVITWSSDGIIQLQAVQADLGG